MNENEKAIWTEIGKEMRERRQEKTDNQNEEVKQKAFIYASMHTKKKKVYALMTSENGLLKKEVEFMNEEEYEALPAGVVKVQKLPNNRELITITITQKKLEEWKRKKQQQQTMRQQLELKFDPKQE